MTDQTPEARLAAALYHTLWGDYEPGNDDHLAEQPEEWFDPPLVLAKSTLAADPTLAADLALAAAVRRLSDSIAWTLRGGPDGVATEAWNTQTGAVGSGDTIEAAITEALRDD